MTAAGASRRPGPVPLASTTGRPARQRAGGRSEQARAKVAQAVLSYLREGRSNFSVAEVAERAEIHRTTVYRWWPTPTDLLREALTVHGARLVLPDMGSWPSDVHAAVDSLATFLSDPVELALTAAFAAGDDPAGNEIQVTYWRPVGDQLEGLARRAIERGEVRPDTDPATVSLLVIGPVATYALAFRRPPPTAVRVELASAVTRAYGVAVAEG